MLKRLLALTLIVVASTAVQADERLNTEVMWKIRAEGTDHSQIMRTMHILTDVYGPRLTGSPNHKAAADWALKQMAEWGFKNGHLEPWDFGHDGWQNERFSGFITSPIKDTLTAEVLAWTPSTNGTASGTAVQLVPPTPATKEQLAQYLDGFKDKVRGHMVLVGAAAKVPVTIVPPAKRREDQDVRNQYAPGGPAGPQGPPAAAPAASGTLTARQSDEQVDAFLVANGALVRINDAGREHGQIRAFNNRTFDVTTAVPTVVLRNEDYGRIARILADGTPVGLEFTIVNKTFPEGKTTYNTIAEIPGTDKADEVVMLGGHLDSWHSATGATDNAIGCAVMMEAARIIQALGIKPRRTIRVALWSGEEQGLLGSAAYVKEHFGTFEAPKPEYAKFAGYFNIDSGTGRARGASVFGPAEAATILRETFKPFEDLGVMGASATRSRLTGGTDSTSFNAAGLPGIGMGQDPIEYGTATWHTNLDTYERIIEADARASAISIAAAVYQLAMRDAMLPRFTPDQMPKPATAGR